MPPFPSPPSKPAPSWRTTFAAATKHISDHPDHPVQIALRTYSFCLLLSLSPRLPPLIFALAVRPKSSRARARVFWHALRGELHPTGFASAITTAVGGGAALYRLWDWLARQYTLVNCISLKLSPCRRAFLANVATSTLAITLLQHRRLGKASPTLDLNILFLVRALDALVQALFCRKAREIAAREIRAVSGDGVLSIPSLTPSDTSLSDKRREDLAREWQKMAATRLDAFVFWASSARITWCFFYQPQRLPFSYVKWINSLANVDKRLLGVLRGLRKGTWSYIHGSPTQRDLIGHLAEELGRSPSWGDPTLLPAYGGDSANETWKQLGVNGRSGIGGIPCELVHGGIGASLGLHTSCVANTAIRAMYAFAEALVIYLPVHFLPILLTQPRSIIRLHRTLPALLSVIRSATFLSTLISSFWLAVCFTRTRVLARFFPKISHDVWDGPYGCILAGSLVCGASIWIENARRRGEVALYVLPKALKASIPERWLRSRHPVVQFAECLTFVLSLASLLTFSVHEPESLRGVSRWTLAFVMKGPNASFWKKRRREITSCPPTPVDPPSSSILDGSDHHED